MKESHTSLQQVILVADDDPYACQLLDVTFKAHGFRVLVARNGHELVELAQQHIPHVILTDLLMPRMDGYEAIRQIRGDTRTAHIPVLIITARSRSSDLVTGFETGADDYIVKPFDLTELLVRVKSHLRRTSRPPVHHPLSGLPGGRMLLQELRRRMDQLLPLALLHIDIDNFKTFNDTYGFARGDQAILLVAQILQDVVAAQGQPDDFIGHIGGDDFAIVANPAQAEHLCQTIIDSYKQRVRALYPAEDWQRGYVFGADRYGVLRRFNITSLSIGVATNQARTFHDEEEVALVAAEVKYYAKMQHGDSYAIDQRTTRDRISSDRRFMHKREMIILSDDTSFRSTLHTAFQEQGYVLHGLSDCAQVLFATDGLNRPTLLLADAALGQPLRELCTHLAVLPHPPAMVVLTSSAAESERFLGLGVAACLQEPLPLAEIIQCVERLVYQSLRFNTPRLSGEW